MLQYYEENYCWQLSERIFKISCTMLKCRSKMIINTAPPANCVWLGPEYTTRGKKDYRRTPCRIFLPSSQFTFLFLFFLFFSFLISWRFLLNCGSCFRKEFTIKMTKNPLCNFVLTLILFIPKLLEEHWFLYSLTILLSKLEQVWKCPNFLFWVQGVGKSWHVEFFFREASSETHFEKFSSWERQEAGLNQRSAVFPVHIDMRLFKRSQRSSVSLGSVRKCS